MPTKNPSDDLTDQERILFGGYNLARELAASCRQLTDMRVSVSENALTHLVNTFTTELWDRGFNQSEIRAAYLDALADLDRYAAGSERR